MTAGALSDVDVGGSDGYDGNCIGGSFVSCWQGHGNGRAVDKGLNSFEIAST